MFSLVVQSTLYWIHCNHNARFVPTVTTIIDPVRTDPGEQMNSTIISFLQ